ncbi:Hypothetical protein A7982_05617 [Minicystis rosea]|nr:Hypothetical protein A7982_05617 [Minicystis rosea]
MVAEPAHAPEPACAPPEAAPFEPLGAALDLSDLPAPLPSRHPEAASSIGISFLLHVAVLLASARAIPPLGAEITWTPDQNLIHTIFASTDGTGEPDLGEHVPEIAADDHSDGQERFDSRCGEWHGGASGVREAAAQHRYAVQGPADNADPHLAYYRESHRDRQDHWWTPADPRWPPAADAPTMIWGRDDVLGNDATNARGSLWGEAIGPARGLMDGVGIGLFRRCDTCGAVGRGIGRDSLTSEGGPTDTEGTLYALQAR